MKASSAIPTTLLAHIDEHLAYDKKKGWLVHRTAGKAKIKGSRAGAERKGETSRRIVTIRHDGRAKQLPEDKVIWYLVKGEWPSSTINHVDGDLRNSKIENLSLETTNPVKVAWSAYREKGLSAEVAAELFNYDPKTGLFRKRNTRGEWKSFDPYEDEDGYYRMRVFGRQLPAHRLAFLLKTGDMPEIVDHINGDRKDNRWKNLRPATSSENACNSVVKVNNRLGHKNIIRVPSGAFQVSVAKTGKKRVYRNFDDLPKAIAFRDKALAKSHRSFASNRLRREDYGIAQAV